MNVELLATLAAILEAGDRAAGNGQVMIGDSGAIGYVDRASVILAAATQKTRQEEPSGATPHVGRRPGW